MGATGKAPAFRQGKRLREITGVVTDTGRYNRREIMREAHRAYRLRRGKGMTFGDALRFAWGRAREARDRRRAELAAFERLHWAA